MPQRSTPKIVQDVHRRRSHSFAARAPVINLAPPARSFTSGLSDRMKHALRVLVIVGGVGFLLFGSATAPTIQTLAKTPTEERAALETQLQQLEAEIAAHQTQIGVYRKQGSSLSGEIGKLNSTISSLNAQIRAINLTMSQLDRKIGATQDEIVVTQNSIAQHRETLGGLIQAAYVNDQNNLLEIFLKHDQLSDFFTNVNNVTVLQDSVRTTIGTIANLKEQLEEHEQDLTAARDDVASAKQYQTLQKSRADQVREEKQRLLSATKGEQKKYEQLLAQKRAEATQIRTRLFTLLGGGQLQFGDAYRLAKLAGDATGVRPALILAVLDRESALGRNVGRCSYSDAMSPANKVVFLQLVAELKIEPDSVKVSCAIPSDGAYGGAMGPAQFIPTTWQSYQSRIASVTGHNPPSPWNNLDAFVATALYMKDAGAAGGDVTQERIAAAKYYAGGNWRRFLWTYGQAVVNRATQFEDDIATLNDP